jgi:hypothetical protein
MSSDLQAEVDRLRIEVEDLKARLTLAKAGPARRGDDRFSRRSKAEQAAIDAETRAYLEGRIRQAGFDPATERNAYFAWAYRQARGEPEPAAGEITAPGFLAERPLNGTVKGKPAPPASDDPLSVYLPPPDVATPEGVARAAAIAEGRLVDLPKDPLARAIIRAAAKAANEPEPGSKPL